MSILQVKKLNIKSSPFKYLRDVNFLLKPREVVGIISDNNENLKLFVDVLIGFAEEESGSIYVNNKLAQKEDRKNKNKTS